MIINYSFPSAAPASLSREAWCIWARLPHGSAPGPGRSLSKTQAAAEATVITDCRTASAPFLHHIIKGKPQARWVIVLKVAVRERQGNGRERPGLPVCKS